MASGPYPDVSVLLATAHRPALLDRTLASIAVSAFPAERLEILVADNAGLPETRAVCNRRSGSVPIHYCEAREGGKNCALNRIVPQARGELLVFTDDDVRVSETWPGELRAAAGRWPDHDVFGGKITPDWPGPCPGHLRRSRYFDMLFSALDHGEREGPDPAFQPFGPNLAIRRRVFDRGVRFDESVGPGTGSSYTMGSETELIFRLVEGGRPAVYVPDSVVHHRIRAEQYSLRWVLRRGVRYGRMIGFQEGLLPGTLWFGAPRWLYRVALSHAGRAAELAMLGRKDRAFDRAMEAAITWGRIQHHRARGNRRPATAIRRHPRSAPSRRAPE